MNKPRRVLTLPNPLPFLVWGFVFVGVFYGVYWLFIVPSTSTRAMLCPRHEEAVELYDDAADRRPLKEYEKKSRAESVRYVEKWCQ